ncbi:MAG: NAD(P)/FAD-dependent oxidoreductase [Thermoguttaceae bacterium]
MNPADYAAAPIARPTVSFQEASRRAWQVVVVGAGPAGSLAARELARGGIDVLLVDRSAFPRRKVCGGCLGPGGLAVLDECGLGRLVGELGGRVTTHLSLVGQTSQALLRLRGGAAVSREVLDAALVLEAVREGAHFLDRTAARLAELGEDDARLRLRCGDETSECTARVVVAADGLAGNLLGRWPGLKTEVSAGSRIGLGTVLPDDPFGCKPGVVGMTCGPAGYVGMVRVEGERLVMAAAVEPEFLRQAGGSPGEAVARHLAAAGLDARQPCLEAQWQATPPLTRRRRRPWDRRLLVIGDAAGYVEPFTGEGMTWALQCGRLVASFARQGAERWSPEVGMQWERCYRRAIRGRQWVCRTIAALSRHPRLSEATIRLCGQFPWLAAPVLGRVSRPESCRQEPACDSLQRGPT